MSPAANTPVTALQDRVAGCLGGAAIGDALGGAVETYLPAQIVERHGGRVQGIVGPWTSEWRTARPISPHHKGDGHVTDDTLMTRALAKAYLTKRDHLDAFDMAHLLAPQLSQDLVWIPELEEELPLLRRLAPAEQWLHIRLIRANADPREAGVGNVVNCGAAMYIAPVGIVNAADPDAAYAEAIDLAGAHQWSYGREAAGVMAACVAQALAPGADVPSILTTALRLAQDGTRAAIAAVTEAAREVDLDGDYAPRLRAAMAPFDTVGEDYRDNPGLGARRASRLHSIEELPLALGLLVAGGDDLRATVLAAVNYGRDCDSIATMAGALLGALYGTAILPPEWVQGVEEGSRMDIFEHAVPLSELCVELVAAQLARAQRRSTAVQALQTDSRTEEER